MKNTGEPYAAGDVCAPTVEDQLKLDRLLFGLSCHYVDESGDAVRVPPESVKYRVDDGVYEVSE